MEDLQMNTSEGLLEYELIDISFDIEYEVPDNESAFVKEDELSDKDEELIEYDENGIPMGDSIDDIRKREAIIAAFLSRWRETNTEGKVLNDALNDFIYFRNISYIEAKEHSAKSYKSTRAIMILDEVLKNARPIKRVSTKIDDKNQQDFEYLMVMLYKYPDIGSIKLTVGVIKRSARKIQYGISALKTDQPLVDYSQFKRKKKKRNPRK